MSTENSVGANEDGDELNSFLSDVGRLRKEGRLLTLLSGYNPADLADITAVLDEKQS